MNQSYLRDKTCCFHTYSLSVLFCLYSTLIHVDTLHSVNRFFCIEGHIVPSFLNVCYIQCVTDTMLFVDAEMTDTG